MNRDVPVWITGVGTCTPLGTTYADVAAALLAGRSCIDRAKGFDVEQHPSQVAGQVSAVPCPPGDDPTAFAALDRQEQLVRWCCAAALRDAGLWDKRHDLRIGLVLGVGAE
ncbi:MAG: beta-ketoacyl synthase N-terminal-like domain-containing protein [Gemmataceae bacterium]